MFIVDEDDMLDISAFTYKGDNTPVETHPDLGLKYHIITYRESEDGMIVEPDMFEAVIGNPYHYVANLLTCGFFGTICKKTIGSAQIVNDMFNDLVRIVTEQGQIDEQTN